MFVVGLLTQRVTQAQGTLTYLSNLGQPSSGSDIVGSNSWLFTTFRVGTNPNGYVLNSIQLEMTDASGTPSGFTVMLYGQANNPFGGFIGSSLGTLSGSTNPSTAGIYTYTDDSNLILSPHATYYIVLTAGTAVANGAYDWSLAGANSYNPSDGWNSLGGDLQTSSNGSSWSSPASYDPQYAINATAIPEPSPSWLVLLGSGIFIYVRRAFHR